MLTFIAALSGTIVLPEIVPDTGSYPSDAIRKGRSAAALVEFVVDPDGRRVSCQTLAEFGDTTLSKEICKLQQRAKFKPAANKAGQSSYGVVRAFIKYIRIGSEDAKEISAIVVPEITHEVIGTAVRTGSRPPDINKFREEAGPQKFLAYPDIDFQVQSLPEDSGEKLYLRVTVSLDAGGTVLHCAPNLPANADANLSRYANVACQQLQGVDVADPLIVDGEPVAHVRPLQIEFSTAPKN